MHRTVLKEIRKYKNPKRAEASMGFFKTKRGQYGEGDLFWGLTVPDSRRIAKKYKDISFLNISFLLKHKVHEVRLIGLLILVWKYQQAIEKEKEKIVKFYLKNTKYVNNWDLVDSSAYQILGEYLVNKKPACADRDRKILLELAKSGNLWKERIAMVATFAFIKNGDVKWTFEIAKIFLSHRHDLIHKATGWMLREAGKKDMKALRKFLDKNISKMPRTMLRYSIERFPDKLRLQYLGK